MRVVSGRPKPLAVAQCELANCKLDFFEGCIADRDGIVDETWYYPVIISLIFSPYSTII